MQLAHNEKYQLKITLDQFVTYNKIFGCEQYITSNLNIIGIAKCHIYGTVLEIIFNPTSEITDEYIFGIIEDTLKEISVSFVKAVIRQYVGNAARTVAASVTGGAVGARGGAVGLILGLVAGAVIEKALFDWKPLCECTRNKFGSLIVTRHCGDNV